MTHFIDCSESVWESTILAVFILLSRQFFLIVEDCNSNLRVFMYLLVIDSSAYFVIIGRFTLLYLLHLYLKHLKQGWHLFTQSYEMYGDRIVA